MQQEDTLIGMNKKKRFCIELQRDLYRVPLPSEIWFGGSGVFPQADGAALLFSRGWSGTPPACH